MNDLPAALAAPLVLDPREVPLGGYRAMTVHRTLPHRDRAFVGAWCFLDHYGPIEVGADSPGMDVAPHPHTGLQTVSWLFEGEIEHRDSAGNHAMVRPGELNLMTAGSGISHSEVSTPQTRLLHGVQLWVVLPEATRDQPGSFVHHVPDVVKGDGFELRVFIGELPWLDSSLVEGNTPLVGAEVSIMPGETARIPVQTHFEHALLVDHGHITIEGQPVAARQLVVLDPGRDELVVTAREEAVRLMLIGGEPFTEEVIMWWNFVGRSHDEVVQYRDEWQAAAQRFGTVEGYVGERDRIPAPGMPNVRLLPTVRRGRKTRSVN